MLQLFGSAGDAFNNPDNPWYYVIGVLFLLLLVGALVAYMLISKKLAAKKSEYADGDVEETDVKSDGENKFDETEEVGNSVSENSAVEDSEENKTEEESAIAGQDERRVSSEGKVEQNENE